MHKSNSRGTSIDATPARRRGGAGSSPLDGASTAAFSSRKDLVKNAPDSLIDLCTGTKHAAEIGVITKADDIVCAVHAYKAGATKNVAMRFYYAGAAL